MDVIVVRLVIALVVDTKLEVTNPDEGDGLRHGFDLKPHAQVSNLFGIREAGDLFDIQLMDHVIIGDGRFTSMKEKKLGF